MPTHATRVLELPDVNFEHLGLLTDHPGILQHADFSVPREGRLNLVSERPYPWWTTAITHAGNTSRINADEF
jgi:hypothetical protein